MAAVAKASTFSNTVNAEIQAAQAGQLDQQHLIWTLGHINNFKIFEGMEQAWRWLAAHYGIQEVISGNYPATFKVNVLVSPVSWAPIPDGVDDGLTLYRNRVIQLMDAWEKMKLQLGSQQLIYDSQLMDAYKIYLELTGYPIPMQGPVPGYIDLAAEVAAGKAPGGAGTSPSDGVLQMLSIYTNRFASQINAVLSAQSMAQRGGDPSLPFTTYEGADEYRQTRGWLARTWSTAKDGMNIAQFWDWVRKNYSYNKQGATEFLYDVGTDATRNASFPDGGPSRGYNAAWDQWLNTFFTGGIEKYV